MYKNYKKKEMKIILTIFNQLRDQLKDTKLDKLGF